MRVLDVTIKRLNHFENNEDNTDTVSMVDDSQKLQPITEKNRWNKYNVLIEHNSPLQYMYKLLELPQTFAMGNQFSSVRFNTLMETHSPENR